MRAWTLKQKAKIRPTKRLARLILDADRFRKLRPRIRSKIMNRRSDRRTGNSRRTKLGVKVSTRVATLLVVALIALGTAQTLSGQETAVLIDLTRQTAYLLESGRVTLISPVASGKEGWGTPTGKFRVINKDLNHISAGFGYRRCLRQNRRSQRDTV